MRSLYSFFSPLSREWEIFLYCIWQFLKKNYKRRGRERRFCGVLRRKRPPAERMGGRRGSNLIRRGGCRKGILFPTRLMDEDGQHHLIGEGHKLSQCSLSGLLRVFCVFCIKGELDKTNLSWYNDSDKAMLISRDVEGRGFLPESCFASFFVPRGITKGDYTCTILP